MEPNFEKKTLRVNFELIIENAVGYIFPKTVLNY